MEITGIDLFDQNVLWHGKLESHVHVSQVLIYLIKMSAMAVPMRFICSWISLALIYLIKKWI